MGKKTAFLPSFDESFLNYGFNKVQWIENLRYLGYEFYVATNAFAVDVPHKASPLRGCVTSRSNHAKNYRYSFIDSQQSMIHVYRAFLQKLRSESDRSRQLLCLKRGESLGGVFIVDCDVWHYRF